MKLLAVFVTAYLASSVSAQTWQSTPHASCDGETCYTTNNCGDQIGTARCYTCCNTHCLDCATDCQDECDERVFALAFDRYREIENASEFLKIPEIAVDELSSGWYSTRELNLVDALELEWFYASASDPMVARWALALGAGAMQDDRAHENASALLRSMLLDGVQDDRSWKIRRVAVNTLAETGMLAEPDVLAYVISRASVDPSTEFSRHVIRVLARMD